MLSLFIAAALAGAPQAQAATPAQGRPLTRSNAIAKLDSEFASMDTDRNGVLTRQEVQARMDRMKLSGGKQFTAQQKQALATIWFSRADTNKDGQVTKVEARQVMTQVFNHYDANRDGKLGATDRAAAVRQLKKQVPAGR